MFKNRSRTRHSVRSVTALLLISALLFTLSACGSAAPKGGLVTTPEEAEMILRGELNVGGRQMLTKTYMVEEDPTVDDPMNIATPEPTLPPPGTDSGDRLIALTFDDGPTGDTVEFVEALNELDVDCTFFMLGYLIESYPEAVEAMVAGGHQIASHSYDHPNLKNSGADKVDYQLYTTEQLLSDIDGKSNHYIRCPYGESGDYVKSMAPGPLIYWSLDTVDWQSRNADAVYNAIMNNAYDGCIILCHDIYESTRQGALRAIPDLKAAGYELVTVEELLKRRGVDIQNGVTYYDAQNEGTTYPAGVVPLTFGSFAEGKQP